MIERDVLPLPRLNVDDKAVPYDIEAEEAVLGSLLLDRDAIIKVAPFLKADDFFRDSHKWTYAAMLDLYNRREPGDLITVSSELGRREKLEAIGGPAFLSSLLNRVPTSLHVEHYARVVERVSTLRRLIDAGSKIVSLGYNESQDASQALDKAEQILFSVAQSRVGHDFAPVRDVLASYFDKIEHLHENKGAITGVPTGFHDLDQLTGGLQQSDLIILAARPSVGKTSMALNIGLNAAQKGHKSVAIFSLEMSGEQLVQRLLSMETGIDSQRLRLGYINEEEWQSLTVAFGRLAEQNIYIDDSAGISPLELRSKCRRLQSEAGVDLIIIDYLQLMTTGRRTDNRVQEVSEISRSLKGLARELNVPVIALSQLSRGVETRTSHVPQLSDLRESGSIEQDADVVMFIYREEMYNPETDKKGIAEIHVAKHRNGPIGQANLFFQHRTTSFRDLESYRHES